VFMETRREESTGEVGGVWFDNVYFALDNPVGEGEKPREKGII